MTMMAIAAKTATANKPEVLEGQKIKDGKEEFKEIFGALLFSLVPPTEIQQGETCDAGTQEIQATESLPISGRYYTVWPTGDIKTAQIPTAPGIEVPEGTLVEANLAETTLLASNIQESAATLQVLEKEGLVREIKHHIQSENAADVTVKDVGTALLKKESQDVCENALGNTQNRAAHATDVKQPADMEVEHTQIQIQELSGSVRAQSPPQQGVDVPRDVSSMKPGDVKAFSDLVVQEIHSMSEGDVDTIRVRLTPEKFGEMEVVLKMDQGKITGKIFVENPEAKSAFIDKLGEMNKSLSFVNATIFGVDIGFGSGGEAKQESYLNHSFENAPAFMEEKTEDGSVNRNIGAKTPLRGINMLA